MRRKTTLLLTILLALLPALGHAQFTPDKLVGPGGTLYEIHTGRYGELFPADKAVSPDRSVLALDVTRPGAETVRLQVPTTGDAAVESAAHLIHAAPAESISVLWKSDQNEGSELRLIRYANGEFSEVERVFRTAGTLPRLIVTRDVHHVAVGQERITVERNIVHLFETRIADDGYLSIRYIPIILVAGSYIGWYEVFDLEGVGGPGEELDSAPYFPEAMRGALQISVSDDRQTVNVAFASERTLRLESFQIGILPLELALLGDVVREEILATPFDPANLSSFAGGAGIMIVPTGRRMGLDEKILDLVDAEVNRRIAAVGADYTAEEIDRLAEDMRDYTRDYTASLFDETVTARVNGRTLELDVGEMLAEAEQPALSQILDLRTAQVWALPIEVEGDDVRLFVSDDSHDALVVWKREDRLWFVETVGDGWSPPAFLVLGPRLSLDEAHRLLGARVH